MYSMAVVVECCLKHRRIGVASVQLLYTPTVRSQRKRKDYIHVTPKRNNDDRIYVYLYYTVAVYKFDIGLKF